METMKRRNARLSIDSSLSVGGIKIRLDLGLRSDLDKQGIVQKSLSDPLRLMKFTVFMATRNPFPNTSVFKNKEIYAMYMEKNRRKNEKNTIDAIIMGPSGPLERSINEHCSIELKKELLNSIAYTLYRRYAYFGSVEDHMMEIMDRP